MNIKIIFPLALVFGAVACEPIPVYPPNRQFPPRRVQEYQERRPEVRDTREYQDTREYREAPDYRNGRETGRDSYRDPLGNYEDRDQRPSTSTYPVAERTDDRNRVLSPYAPYNVIDVEGFRSGQLAKDPSNGKIFRIP